MRTQAQPMTKLNRSDTICALVMSVMGAALVVIATHHYGPGISPDSVAYISAARSFSHGHGMYQYDGTPLLLWPPGLPFALAVLVRVGLGYRAAAIALNGMLFAGFLALSYVLVFRATGNRLLTRLVTACVLVAFPVVSAFTFVWSEAPYLFLVLLSLTMALRLVERPTWRMSFVLGLVLAVACLTRYIGIALVFAAAMSVLILCTCAIRKRIGLVCALSTPPVAAMFPWLLRNRLVSGTLAGPRLHAIYTPSGACFRMMYALGNWILPGAQTSASKLLSVAVIATGVLVFAAVMAIALKFRKTSAADSQRPVAVVMAGYVIVHLVLLCISASTSYVDIDGRTISPVYVPLCTLFAYLVCSVSGKLHLGRSAVAAVVLIPAVLPIQRTVRYVRDCIHNGSPLMYAAAGCQRSALVSAAAHMDWRNVTVSNAPDLMYLYTGHVPGWLPRRLECNGSSYRVTDELPAFSDWLKKQRQVHVIWVDGIRGFRYSPAELAPYVTVVSRTTYPNGVIEVITPRQPAASVPGSIRATGSVPNRSGGGWSGSHAF